MAPRRGVRQASESARKTRITIRLDDDVLTWFRNQSRGEGGGYQSLINLALHEYIAREPLETTLRRVIREELARSGRRASPYGYDDEAMPLARVADADDSGPEYGATSKRRHPRRPGRARR